MTLDVWFVLINVEEFSYVLLWIKELVAKMCRSNYKCSDVSFGLQRLHYNSCLIYRCFINVSCSIIFKEAFIATVQLQSTSERCEGSKSNEAGFSCQSCINRELCACPQCCYESSATRSSSLISHTTTFYPLNICSVYLLPKVQTFLVSQNILNIFAVQFYLGRN